MRWVFWGLVIASLVACEEAKKKKSSDDDDGKGGSTTVTTTTSATSGSGGAAAACGQACSDLYDCGLEWDDGGDQLCPGFSGTVNEKTAFVGDSSGGCIASCEQLPALIGLVDPNDCASTIANISGANATFDQACQFGFGN
jgi:hypothetical protein